MKNAYSALYGSGYVRTNEDILCPEPWRVPTGAQWELTLRALYDLSVCTLYPADVARAEITKAFANVYAGTYLSNTGFTGVGFESICWSKTPAGSLAISSILNKDGGVNCGPGQNTARQNAVRCVRTLE
jgi:uncharacterized protein (TIGR02145 family)